MSGKDELELIPENKPKDLVLDAPGPKEKGFLRRQNEIVQFQHAFESSQRKGEIQPDLIQRLVKFLLEFVTVPEDRKEAEEILWELSQDEFEYIMASLRGAGDDMVPPTNASP